MRDVPKLTLVQNLKLRIFGRVNIGPRKKEGWTGPVDHYVFKCDKHGLVVDYPHGHAQVLRCPFCKRSWSNESE